MRLLRYGFVGIASNLAGYLVYLAVTGLGAPPKASMTVLYAAGATVGFVGHRNWTYDRGVALRRSLPRYLVAHLAGYGLNYGLLYAFHDRLGYPHQAVQAFAIVAVAGFLYVALGRYVFAATQAGAR
jgi:putative flippase GtrA